MMKNVSEIGYGRFLYASQNNKQYEITQYK
jgi:hypothetical protein